MRITRREALAGAGAAWLALSGGRAAAMVPQPAVRTAMGRGIDLTAQGLRTPGALQDYTVLRAQPWAPPLIARATHIRFWADWPFLQPDPRYGLADPANPGLPHLAALDAQLDAAVADGLQPIVMPWRYPRWVNHTSAPSDRKSPEWRLPDSGHGPFSPWAGFVETLWERYAGRMACFEVVNEPNYQLWPQPGVAERVAWMIATVDGIARRHDHAATCLAPSISDAASGRPAALTESAPFIDALLAALGRRGFAGGDHWVWSFHNYNDVEAGGNSRAIAMRERLSGRWRGRAAPDGKPLMYATEGGARMSGVRRRYGIQTPARQLAAQAAMLTDALERFERTPGVGLFTQYTVTADPDYDCGLRGPDGSARPAFTAFVA
jgi:hypothetical protein